MITNTIAYQFFFLFSAVPVQIMSSRNSKNEDFKTLIDMALQNKFSWKALGNLLKEGTLTLADYKQLVAVLLTELETLHQMKQIDIQPEVEKVLENEMTHLETSYFEDKIEVYQTEDQVNEIQSEGIETLEMKENMEHNDTQNSKELKEKKN